jgi:hypothetical protein
MEKFLTAYIERMRPLFTELSEVTAHELASAFLAFKFGLYANAVRECSHALAHIPAGDPYRALQKAVTIVQENARDLDNSQVVADLSVAFPEQEIQFVAVNLPPEKIEDPATLNLDNALIMIYTVALLQSPEDEQPLDEHRKFIVRLLAGYKKALGIP